MKRLVCCIISLILLFSIGCAESVIDVGEFFRFSTAGDYLWLKDSMGRDVTVYDPQNLEVISEFSVDFDTRQMWAQGDTVYFVINDGTEQRIIQLDTAGNTVNEWDVDTAYNIYHVTDMGDGLMLVVNPDPQEIYDEWFQEAVCGWHQLYCMSKEDGSPEHIEEMQDISRAAYLDGSIVSMDPVRGKIYVMDYESRSMIAEWYIPDSQLFDLSLTGDGKAYFVADEVNGSMHSYVGCIDIYTGEQSVVLELDPASGFAYRISVNNGYLFGAYGGDKALIQYKLTAE